MTPILTLTMNPSLDLATEAERVVTEQKNRCFSMRRDPGGGGINVSRVILTLGGRTHAIYPAGGPAALVLRALLDGEGVDQEVVPIKGPTRENLTVLDGETGEHYQFVLEGPELQKSDWQGCLDRVAEVTVSASYVVASGSLPPGVPEDFYARLARALKKTGARVVVDTSGPPLAAALEEGVFLAKPNLGELEDLAGTGLTEPDQQDGLIQELLSAAKAEMIALTLGPDGAAVFWPKDKARVAPPPIAAHESAVGAGDSFLGAFVLGLAQNLPIEDALRYGVAAGTAALLTPGTELCHKADVERLSESLRADPPTAAS